MSPIQFRMVLLRQLAAAGMPWVMLAVTAVLFLLVATLVDLRPVVDEHFFFSSRDTAVRQSRKVGHCFPSSPNLILAVSARDISSAQYLGRIARLTRAVRSIDQVTSVKSLTAVPKNFEDAIESPFWRRLLISQDRKSSNLVLFVEKRIPRSWSAVSSRSSINSINATSAFTSPARLMSSR